MKISSIQNKYIGRLVLIEWSDIYESVAWRTLEEAFEVKAADCINIGFLLDITDTEAYLTSGYSLGDWNPSNLLVIPKGAIKHIHYLDAKQDVEEILRKAKVKEAIK